MLWWRQDLKLWCHLCMTKPFPYNVMFDVEYIFIPATELTSGR